MAAEPTRDPVRTFFGYALIAVGGLMMVLCGLCTAAFLVLSAASPGGGGVVAMALPIGGVPTGIGVALFLIGRNILRKGLAPEPPDG